MHCISSLLTMCMSLSVISFASRYLAICRQVISVKHLIVEHYKASMNMFLNSYGIYHTYCCHNGCSKTLLAYFIPTL